jgi:hypothetical protein
VIDNLDHPYPWQFWKFTKTSRTLLVVLHHHHQFRDGGWKQKEEFGRFWWFPRISMGMDSLHYQSQLQRLMF